MLSIKPIIYRHYRRGDGLFAVKLRVTYNRQTRYFDTPLTAELKQLTRDLDGFRDQRLNSAACRCADQLRALLDQHAADIHTIADVQRIVAGERTVLPLVADWADTYVQRIEADGRAHTAANYRTATLRLREFAPVCTFADITPVWLNRYQQHLAKRMGDRGVQLYLSCLRKIYNAALDEFNADGTERLRRSPFEHYSIPTPGETRKRALTVHQLRQIVAFKPEGDALAEFARDVFVLSFCFCGINTVDLFTLTDLTDERLTYNRSKTKGKRRDGALLSVAVLPQARPYVDKFRTGNRFNFSRTYKNDYTFNQAVNKGLKRVGAAVGIPGLQFYAARHSWATIARNDCNVAMDDVALALCHARNTVTDIYVRRDFSRIDDANRKVLRLVFKQDPYQALLFSDDCF